MRKCCEGCEDYRNPAMCALFERTGYQNGQLFCRLNLPPEIDGYEAMGRICFPDRSMAGVCEGKAVVTGVKEKGSYGFLMGHMIQYGIAQCYCTGHNEISSSKKPGGFPLAFSLQTKNHGCLPVVYREY